MKNRLELSPDELRSRVWLKVRAFLQAELDALRIANDTDLDIIKTSQIRGQIKAVRRLLESETRTAKQILETTDG